jgi:hypothetical protein
VPRHCMPIKRIAHCKQMVKKFMKKQAVGWTASTLTDLYVAKDRKEGVLAASIKVVFANTEIIPTPQPGFRVMFLAFLLCGLSLSPCPRISSWASFCVWRAAASAHAKFHLAYCLLHHSV